MPTDYLNHMLEKKQTFFIGQLTTNVSAWNLQNTTTTAWHSVLWSNKTKIELLGNKHSWWVWHKKNDGYIKSTLSQM